MTTTESILIVLNAICMYMAFAPLLRLSHWVVRIFDFPRMQVAVILLLQVIANVNLFSFESFWHYMLTALMALGVVLQLKRIFPYTPMAKCEVHKVNGGDDAYTVTILVCNVLMHNRAYERLLKIVDQEQPDLLLTLETDVKWEQALSVLEKDWPHTVKVPMDNLYGMHFYSRIKLENVEVRYLVDEEIPSIKARIKLPDGKWLHLFGLHPMPPSPTENSESTDRDGELLLVGKEAKAIDGPVVVFGDLNDVAWSRSTLLFRKVSSLLDPRIGRGPFNTFHVKYPLLRWPLDHIFHSSHFTLIDIRRMPSMGSDHFPIYIKLAYNMEKEKNGHAPKEDADDKAEAEEKIEEALNKD